VQSPDLLPSLDLAAAIASDAPALRRRAADGWLARWLQTMSEYARLQGSHPMVDAVIQEQHGRRIRVGDQWLADFASCNYLGLDLEPEIIAAIPRYLEQWGTHPSWSRLLGSPVLYEQIEERLTELLGAEDTLLLPTITHIHFALIPILAADGTIYMDRRAHKTIHDGASLARANGAQIKQFRHEDLDMLETLLRERSDGPRVICTDGINSMTGNPPDLARYAALARQYDALLYIDDAHGFGVIGERSEDELCDYGTRGNAVVRHLGESYDNIVLVGGFSKAYSSLMAFVACPSPLKRLLKTAAPPYAYSGPSPVASLATVLEGLAVNERRGDELRLDLHRKTHRLLARLEELEIATPNQSGFPIVEIPIGAPELIDEVGEYLFSRGIYVTLAAYPSVPRSQVGFRVQVTAANPDNQIDHLLDVLGELKERFPFRHPDELRRP
jgi:8-amino-7-oxononanoate synthase